MEIRVSDRRLVLLVMLLMALIIVPMAVYAGVPQTINYQGYLTDTAGAPVDGAVSMTFSLYDTATAGTALWTETQTVTVSNGIYSVNFGEVTSIGLPFHAQ